MTYDPRKHHRRSIRLKGYDYTQEGAYFVTIVAAHHQEIFGEIDHGGMRLSPLGRIVHEEWLRSIAIRREIWLYEDEFVIMPNHIHGIVWITSANEPPVGAYGVRPDDASPYNDHYPPQPRADSIRPYEKFANGKTAFQRAPKSLGSFIAGFKSSVTSRARRELGLDQVWQGNYFDQIIRNERIFQAIWDYIETNPQQWELDRLHPNASPNRFNQS
ncbi:MAG: transposase [Chloroflexota bacterium]